MDNFVEAMILLAKEQGLPLVIVAYVIYFQGNFIERQGKRLEEIGEQFGEMIATLSDIRSSLTTIFDWQKEHEKDSR